jgi:hypothetical protein
MAGDKVEIGKSPERLSLYIVDGKSPFVLNIMKNILRFFPPFKFDSAILKQVDSLLYAFGTNVNPVFIVIENVKNISVQRAKIAGDIEYKNVRIN